MGALTRICSRSGDFQCFKRTSGVAEAHAAMGEPIRDLAAQKKNASKYQKALARTK